MSDGINLSTLKIAMNNIKHRRFRSVCIILLIGLVSLFITGGTLFGAGIKNGINSVKARLGADIMVFPLDAGYTLEGLLLTGEPSTVYLSADIAERIMQLEGIERATAQFFISTYDSAHCVELAQVIGYEPQTDFVIRPWLIGSKLTEPKYRETVVGANITADVGMTVPLFDEDVKIVGRLDSTGMNFDNSFFVNMETARMLFDAYLSFPEAEPLPEGMDPDSVVSVVLMDLKEDTDHGDFQWNLHRGFRTEGIGYVRSQEWIQSTSKNLDVLITVLTILLCVLWIFAVFALVVIFVLMFNERRREFGILRAIGTTRNKLMKILFCESALLSCAGALGGVILACILLFPFNPVFGHFLQTVYLPPQVLSAALIILLGFLSGAIAGPIASFFSARIAGRKEIFENMREAT